MSDRSAYIKECRDNANAFKSLYLNHWVEYIRGRRPPIELLQLKNWLRTRDESYDGVMIEQVRQLVNEKLQKYRRPRGVVVAAIVLDKLYVGHSMCNFSSGDHWNRSIAVWKAMRRITMMQGAYPNVTAIALAEGGYKLTPNNFIAGQPLVSIHVTNEWLARFPSSARETVLRLTRSALEQHIDKSIVAELLPVVP